MKNSFLLGYINEYAKYTFKLVYADSLDKAISDLIIYLEDTTILRYSSINIDNHTLNKL